jgi:hypothetical protein
LDKSNIDFLSSAHMNHNQTTQHCHHPATIIHPAQVSFPADFTYPHYSRQQGEESSLLLLGLAREGRDKCPYSSKANMQSFVRDALKDTIYLMGLSMEFGTRNEYTLFSYRPDIVAVIHKTLGIILLVEVKMPEKDPEESRAPRRKPREASRAAKRVKDEAGLFDSELVAGQVFDYLQGMMNLGNATPFAILTTFDEAALVWTPSGKSDAIIKEELEKFEATYETPVQLKRQSNVPREVYYSPVYTGKNIIPLLMIAIRCGAKAAAALISRALPSDGEKAGGECAMVHATGLEWKKLSASTVWKYNQTPEGNRFFLWKDLGRGASGRAFIPCL